MNEWNDWPMALVLTLGWLGLWWFLRGIGHAQDLDDGEKVRTLVEYALWCEADERAEFQRQWRRR